MKNNARELKIISEVVLDKLTTYLDESQQGAVKVLTQNPPEEIAEKLQLEKLIRKGGLNSASVDQFLDTYLANTQHLHHPHYIVRARRKPDSLLWMHERRQPARISSLQRIQDISRRLQDTLLSPVSGGDYRTGLLRNTRGDRYARERDEQHRHTPQTRDFFQHCRHSIIGIDRSVLVFPVSAD